MHKHVNMTGEITDSDNEGKALEQQGEDQADEEAQAEQAPAEKPQKRRSSMITNRRHTVQLGDVKLNLDVPDEIVDEDDLAMLDDDQFLQAKGEEVPIWFHVRRIDQKTCQCCGIMCSLWIVAIIFLFILSAAIGAVEFDIGVPFYDRGEINQEREDSYLATQRDADYVATFFANVDGSAECVHEAPTVVTRNGTLIAGPAPSSNCQRATDQSFRLLYISKDRTSNILTPENLEEIRKIEDKILNDIELSKWCHLIASNYSAFTTRDGDEIIAEIESTANATEFNYASCARINSILNFMDELFFNGENGLGYHLLPNDVIPQEYDLSQEKIDEVVSFWSNYSTTTYDLSDFPAAIQQVGSEVTVSNLFLTVTSTDFRVGSTEAVGVVSTLKIGLPINGYASSSGQTEDQYADVGEWLHESFDEYLKEASFDGVDVYFADTEGAMQDYETGLLAIQSFSLLPASILFVLFYLMYMQDSLFVGLIGVMQIMLCFVPGLILYRYVFGVEYLGILNLIAIYIILGIGVDDIFVFVDQWEHHKSEKRFDQRLQKTFNVASRAMFTTSCTTFISFLSNAGSVFPAVRTFGIFSATLVLVNFCAVTMFFPAAYGLYYKHIRPKWFDHPSRLFCCNREAWTKDVNEESTSDLAEPVAGDKNKVQDDNSEEVDESNTTDATKDKPDALPTETHEESSKLVQFFEKTWAPMVIKLRYPIIVFFVAVAAVAIYLSAGLEPDEEPPNTLPEDSQYRGYTDTIIENFARTGNPRAIEVRWISGINPDTPIDRAGTDDTNTTDYGTSIYVDCQSWNPITPEAQVWHLKTCQDAFFGNATDFHDGTSDFEKDGKFGPTARGIATDRVPFTEEFYYRLVSCPYQGFRDWLLTDYGCGQLQNEGLECHNETKARQDCTTWDTEGNSCEPYPVPMENWATLYEAFILDPNADASSRLTNYDRYFRQLFVAEVPDLSESQSDKILTQDFSCRMGDERVLLGMSSLFTLDVTFDQNFEDGIDLYELWDEWSNQMRQSGPREVEGTMQTSNSIWSYYHLNETLINETFSNIALALGLSFIVLSIVGGNPVMAFFSVFTIGLIVVDIFAFTVLMGWKLGILEAVNYVVVIGLSIDYTVHLSEAYTESHSRDRLGRVTSMLAVMGVSVLSGALSTLGAVFFMFFAPNTFFVRFASFIFATITISCVYSLTFFPALLSIIGPTGDFGNICFYGGKKWREFNHRRAVKYFETEEFKRRELACRFKRGEINSIRDGIDN